MDFFETHWCVLIILALQCYSSFFLLRVFLNLCPLGSRIFHLGCTFEWIRWLQYSLALFRCRVGLSASTWARRNSLSPCDQRLRHSGGVVSQIGRLLHQQLVLRHHILNRFFFCPLLFMLLTCHVLKQERDLHAEVEFICSGKGEHCWLLCTEIRLNCCRALLNLQKTLAWWAEFKYS